MQQQLLYDCWESIYIRNYASEIYSKRTSIEKTFTRDWMNDFKSRHKNSIEKVKADSLEENRAQISIEEVNRYFGEIDEIMNDPPIPLLLINFY